MVRAQIGKGAFCFCLWSFSFGLHGQAPPDKSGVNASAISLPSGPGSIEGLGESFEPQLNTGASTYSVGFELPPGRAGLQPSLSLSYNSGLGNSFVGIGWSFNLPAIKRQTDKGFPSYSQEDTFLFQGEELVPLTDGTWRCENESSFTRFRQIDSNGDGQLDAWEATERSGLRHIYGSHRGSDGVTVVTHPNRPAGVGKDFDNTYCWALDATVDLHGNRIEYQYTLGEGVLYPAAVVYTRHPKLPENAPLHRVDFDYDLNRPDQFDDYRPTFSAKIDRRLAGVRISTAGQRVRSYQLVYEDVAKADSTLSFGVSMLCQVIQLDRSGSNENFLPPLRFEYSRLEKGLKGAQVQSLAFDQFPELDLSERSGNIQIVDLNADGLPDLFRTNNEAPRRQEAVLNQGIDSEGRLHFSDKLTVDGGFSPPDLAMPQTTLSDFDGDGVTDFLHLFDEFPGKRLEIYSNRSRLERQAEQLGFAENPKRLVFDNVPDFVSYGAKSVRQMDLNFDKSSDFIRLYRDFPNAAIEGAYLQSDGSWALTPVHRFDSEMMPVDLDFSYRGLHLADMNGDRLQDLVYVREHEGFPRRLSVIYWPYCGLGVWGKAREMMPVEGDTLQVDGIPLEDVFLQDLSGDGLADLFYLDGSGSDSILTFRFNVGGNTWTEAETKERLPRYQPRSANSPTVFRTADLNGNGSTDLIWRNTAFGDDSWQWLDLMPDAGKPNLMIRIDNSIGKVTEIEYGNAHQDYVRAQDAGHPWRTKIPFAVQVVREIRTRCGYDLNGDGATDTYVSSFKYRDGYYDGFEREFRGFAFAERIDYGDDYRWDENLSVIKPTLDWNQGLTSTRQVGGPSLVTRFRFHTGASDQQDNDDPPADGSPGWIDEWTEVGGREEEVLKGKQLLEEKVDPRVLFVGAETAFDSNCAKAVERGPYAPITRDRYVYTRARQKWGVRRLYRPTEAVPTQIDLFADGVLDSSEPRLPVPRGRFENRSVLNGNGRSVSFAFVKSIETDVLEANELLHQTLDYRERAGIQTAKHFDYDDYGNAILERDEGRLDSEYDDERYTMTTYALDGEALDRWMIGLPDTIETTDENGEFVNQTKHYYDGDAFRGLPSGRVGARGLVHRVEKYIDGEKVINAQRTGYDDFGNATEMQDPNFGTEFAANGGHRRVITYDPVVHTYPVKETIEVANDQPSLVMQAAYDFGFGVVTQSVDFNGNETSYLYDSFARLVAIVKPGDSNEFPTQVFEYQAFDPVRSEVYKYAKSGHLTRRPGGVNASRVVTHTREVAGSGEVYTTLVFTDGCGKTLAEVGEGELPATWIVSKASSYNLRGTESATWLPYQLAAENIPVFNLVWPSGRPPKTDSVLPEIVRSDVFYDPVGREIATLQPPETWGGVRKQSQTHILPFEKRLFDENDSDPASRFQGTPLVHFEDGLGRLVKVHEVVRLTDEGEVGELTEWETRYTYDLNDKLETITDSQDNLKVMDYDGLARLTFMDDPDRGVMHYVYDPASNLIETTDAKEQTIRYTYEGVNRIHTEDYLDEDSPFSAQHIYDPQRPITAENRPDVAYFYDRSLEKLDVGDGTHDQGNNPLGQLCYVWDLTGEEHFSYDPRGRLEWQVKRIPDTVFKHILVSWQTRYEYDSLDRVTRLTYPDGDRVSYGYNSRNLLESAVGGPSGFIIKASSYRPSAQLSKIMYGNGVLTTYSYDPRLRLRDLDTDSPVDGKLIDYAYTFDSANNITRINDNRDRFGQSNSDNRHNTQVFQYDDLYRLTQVRYPKAPSGVGLVATDTPTIDYRYDRIGNMLLKNSNIEHVENGLSITHLGRMSSGGDQGRSSRTGRGDSSAGPHALSAVSSDGGREYPYDLNGNMTDIDGLKCSWDFKDRLIAAENQRMSVRYQYDYADRRVIKGVTGRESKPVKTEIGNIGPERRNPSTTQYINRYFEIRPDDSELKYVWSGDTRVARIAEILDDTSRMIQRVRLRKGWNLTSLYVDGENAAISSKSNDNLVKSFRWDNKKQSWDVVEDGDLPAYTPLWLDSQRSTVLSLAGHRLTPRVFESRPGQSTWLLSTGGHSIVVPRARGVWFWDYERGKWKTFLFGDSGVDGPFVSWLVDPGQVTYVSGQGGFRIDPFADAKKQVHIYHQDHLGSSNVITGSDGSAIEWISNYPFGFPRSREQTTTLDEVYGFIQKELDPESSLYYLEARYYCAGLGRFVSVDPLVSDRSLLEELGKQSLISVRYPQNLNSYNYARNNPLVRIDSTGLFSVKKGIEYARKGFLASVKKGIEYARKGFLAERESTGEKAGLLGGVVGAAAGLLGATDAQQTINSAYEKTLTEEQIAYEESVKMQKDFDEMNEKYDVNIGVRSLEGTRDRFVEKVSDGIFQDTKSMFKAIGNFFDYGNSEDQD